MCQKKKKEEDSLVLSIVSMQQFRGAKNEKKKSKERLVKETSYSNINGINSQKNWKKKKNLENKNGLKTTVLILQKAN